MIWRKILYILLLPLLLSGCYAYKVFPTGYRNYHVPVATKTVYVVNPELDKELKILRYAGLYNFTDDSTCTTKIKLVKIKRNLSCGNPIIGCAITLGQLPAYMPDRYQYFFEEINGDDIKNFAFELQVAQRYWFWDMFTFQKNFKKLAGRALAANYYQPELTVSRHP